MANLRAIDKKVDYMVDRVTDLVNTLVAQELAAEALEVAGLTRAQLIQLEESDKENDPRVQLYYSTLSLFVAKVLGRAVNKVAF